MFELVEKVSESISHLNTKCSMLNFQYSMFNEIQNTNTFFVTGICNTIQHSPRRAGLTCTFSAMVNRPLQTDQNVFSIVVLILIMF